MCRQQDQIQLANHNRRASAIACSINRRCGGFEDAIRMSGIDVNEIDALVKNAQLEGIKFFCVGTDPVIVIFHDQNDRQLTPPPVIPIGLWLESGQGEPVGSRD